MSIFNKIKKLIKQNNKIQSLVSFNNSTTKHAVNSSCTLELSTRTNEIKKELYQEVKNKIKKYINTPEKLLQYLQLKGVKVYRIKNAEEVLSKIGEEEGFITPQRGMNAITLNFIVKKQIGFTTEEMMIFDLDKLEIYALARALYKYYGFKRKLPGYDYKSQEIFKKIYSKRKNSQDAFANCSIKEIFACKEALARDMESINFTVELSNEYQNARAALKKLKENGTNI